MKLLFCTHEPFYPLSGGCTAGNWNIVKSLVGRGHEVVVAAPIFVDPVPVERECGARIVPCAPFRMHRAASVRMVRYAFYTFFYWRTLSRLLRRERFDAILLRNAVLAWPVRAASRRRRIPAVMSMTDFLTAFLREDRRYPRWLVNRLYRYELRTASWFDRVIVITPRMLQKLLDAWPVLAERVVVGYDGVDTATFDPSQYDPALGEQLRSRLGVSDRLVIYHGTIEPHHGEDVIHEILDRLASHNDCDTLVIAGGKGYEHLRERVRSPRVHFMDFVPHEEMPAYLAAARVGIVPYPTNFGRPGADAQAARVPGDGPSGRDLRPGQRPRRFRRQPVRLCCRRDRRVCRRGPRVSGCPLCAGRAGRDPGTVHMGADHGCDGTSPAPCGGGELSG